MLLKTLFFESVELATNNSKLKVVLNLFLQVVGLLNSLEFKKPHKPRTEKNTTLPNITDKLIKTQDTEHVFPSQT